MKNYYKNKKVLITGGLGFLGSNLAIELVGLGAKVVVIDSLIPEYGGNLFNVEGIADKIKINISDVRDDHSMKYLVRGVDHLFNLAGQTSHMDSMSDPLADLDINARAQLHILEACRKYNPGISIVYASTRQIYGKPEYLPVDEKHPLCPVDINGVNKLAGEQYHMLYHRVYGIRVCVLRLTNTIGPRMRIKDSRQTFLGIWIRFLLEGKPFEVWGGDQIRDFTYSRDATSAFLIAGSDKKAAGNIFNLGGDGSIKLKDLAELLVAVNGEGSYKIKEFPADRKKIDIDDYYADHSKFTKQCRWKPKVRLKQALKETLDYYRENAGNYI
ncbi:MAG: NAD-dependent epimerase/dehydratase family protein [Candidatus Omnitrophica bacterium]|nr:NAD-dependent epimerase/dehydratase family protein [Candidatus Omnitrophota bacterium]